MALRKLAAVTPVIAALALASPVAGASAATTAGSPGSMVPCYPYPAFCGSNGKPVFQVPFWFPFSPTPAPTYPGFGSGPVKLPGF
jgi:hypothetical protein